MKTGKKDGGRRSVGIEGGGMKTSREGVVGIKGELNREGVRNGTI